MEISKFADEQLVDEIAAGRGATPEADPMRLIEQVVHRARAGAGVDFDVFESLLGENDLVEINCSNAVCWLPERSGGSMFQRPSVTAANGVPGF